MTQLLRPEPPPQGTSELPVVPPPAGGADADPDRPRRLRAIAPDDLLEAAIALAGGLSAALALRVLLDWDGLMGFTVWSYAIGLAVLWVLARERLGRLTATDRVMTVLIVSAGLVVIGLLAWMLMYLLAKGARVIRPSFVFDDLADTRPADPGGGVRHAVIGSLVQVGLATVVVVPVAVLTAVYLHEIKGRIAGVTRFVVDALAGLPSIVAGLLVYTTWVIGRGFSGLAAAMALAVLMLPTVTRTAEEILRTVPDSLREASLALGDR